MKIRILVVEDEDDWSELVKDVLERKGYHVTVAGDADAAMRATRPAPPNAVILDWNLGGITGLKLCQMLREEPATAGVPILMLTAMKSEKEKVAGLTAGADDYLVKPFGEEELAARVMALLRRSAGGPSGPTRRYEAKGVVLDLDRHETLVKGKAVQLRPKEFDLLALLFEKRGRVLTRQFLVEAIWGKDYIVTSQTLAQHIKNLRGKLGPCAELIETVETVGYKLRE